MRRGDDTGTLVMAMLVVLVGVMLSLILVPVAVNQLGVTRFQDERGQALGAAEAGLDVALAQIRAANNGSGAGVTGWLPCGPMAGSVSVAATARYKVTIDYFTSDPVGKSDAWIASNRIACTATGGTTVTPTHALLRAEGTDSATGAFGSVPSRKLEATYIFHTDNRTVSGGLIHIQRPSGGLDLCMDAGSDNPANGASLRMQPCNPSSTTQKFIYTKNLTLVLVASKSASNPLGMCLDAATPHASNNLVQFKPCTSTIVPNQQWSTNDNANFEGTTDGKKLDGYCFNLQSPNVAGSFVMLRNGTGCNQAYNNTNSFAPEASVGAGAAGPAIGQLVNFDQFGRCLDVTEQNTGYAYMIAWPCKQAPDPANVSWNQKWTLPAGGTPGTITTVKGATYCLKSPLSTAAGQYVKVAVCPTTLTDDWKWTVNGKTGRYDTSYRVQDNKGFCLSVSDAPDLYPSGNQISKIIVAKCDATLKQKWNATPDILDSAPLTNVIEK